MDGQKILIYDTSEFGVLVGKTKPAAVLRGCISPKNGETITVVDKNKITQYRIEFCAYAGDASTGEVVTSLYCEPIRRHDNE